MPMDLIARGHQVGVQKLIFTARIVVSDGMNVDFLWCFHSMDAANKALHEWIKAGCVHEPQGWHRAKAAYDCFRRRHEGDPAKEYADDETTINPFEFVLP